MAFGICGGHGCEKMLRPKHVTAKTCNEQNLQIENTFEHI